LRHRDKNNLYVFFLIFDIREKQGHQDHFFIQHLPRRHNRAVLPGGLVPFGNNPGINGRTERLAIVRSQRIIAAIPLIGAVGFFHLDDNIFHHPHQLFPGVGHTENLVRPGQRIRPNRFHKNIFIGLPEGRTDKRQRLRIKLPALQILHMMEHGDFRKDVKRAQSARKNQVPEHLFR